MGRYVGDLNHHAIIHESGTYGSVSGAGVWPGLVTGVDHGENTNVKEVRYTGTASRNVSTFVVTAKDYAPVITYHPQDWKILGYALGSIVDSGSPYPYAHALEETNNDDGNAFTSGTVNPPMSFTLECAKQFNPTGLNHVKTYKGCVVDTYTINSDEGGVLECEASLIAKEVLYSSGAVTTVTQDTAPIYIHGKTKWFLPSGTLLNNIRSWSYILSNNLNAPHYGNGSYEIDAPIPENRNHELSIKVDADSSNAKTLYTTYYQTGSTFNMLGIASMITGSQEIILSCSGCCLTDMPDPDQSEGINQWDLKIKPQTVSAIVNDHIFKYNPW